MERKIKSISRKAISDLKTILPSVTLSTGHSIEFEIGQVVYLKMDREQIARMVLGINLIPDCSARYYLSTSDIESWHYGIEISDERDIVKATTG